MPELSNLLRQRLAVTENGVAAGVHPDSDTLTAYVEKSLPAAERQTVVTHLSVCQPCREVVALSQPELPELVTQKVIKPAPVSGWRRLFTPGFGLAASVAAMAVIAVLVLQLPQRSAPPSAQNAQQAKVTPLQDQSPQVQSTQAQNTQPQEKKSLPAQPAEPELSSAAVANRVASAKETGGRTKNYESAGTNVAAGLIAPPPPAKTAAKAPVLTAGLQKKDYVNTNFFAANSSEVVVADEQKDTDFPSAPQPQSAPTNRAFTANSGKIAGFSDIPQNTDGKSNLRILTPAPPPQPFGWKLGKMAQATVHTLQRHATTISPAIRANTLGTSAMGGLGTFSSTLGKGQPAEVAAAPEKAESGSLARSDALSSGALSSKLAYQYASTVWKVAGGKLLKSVAPLQWEDAYPATNGSIEFSFVNARGNDVWAGGSHASLIHSRDGGLTWEIVKLSDAATGTIVNITAIALSVQVKTSDNQTWSSADGGKSWTLRNE
jgi:hypothetical protein